MYRGIRIALAGYSVGYLILVLKRNFDLVDDYNKLVRDFNHNLEVLKTKDLQIAYLLAILEEHGINPNSIFYPKEIESNGS